MITLIIHWLFLSAMDCGGGDGGGGGPVLLGAQCLRGVYQWFVSLGGVCAADMVWEHNS